MRLGNSGLKLIDCHKTNTRLFSEFYLAPTKKRSSRPALPWSDC